MPYTEKLNDALVYAADVHRDQTRKGTSVPNVTHLLAVAAIVGENGGTEDEVVAALLHDAPEDAGGEARLKDIRLRFGAAVAGIVAGCTDTYEDPKPPWRERKEAYLAHLAKAPKPVRLVSAADKLHNARSILKDLDTVGEEPWSRFSATKAQSLWYYDAVAHALSEGWSHPLAGELRQVVDELLRRAGGRE